MKSGGKHFLNYLVQSSGFASPKDRWSVSFPMVWLGSPVPFEPFVDSVVLPRQPSQAFYWKVWEPF